MLKKMITGWHNDYYLILFEEQLQAIEMTDRYGIADRIPNHTLIGMRSWDDFILLSPGREQKIVPTVPLVSDHLEGWDESIDLAGLRPDSSIAEKIKWYTTPIILGGDPTDEANTNWISIDQHIDLVRWWNDKYDEHRKQA